MIQRIADSPPVSKSVFTIELDRMVNAESELACLKPNLPIHVNLDRIVQLGEQLPKCFPQTIHNRKPARLGYSAWIDVGSARLPV